MHEIEKYYGIEIEKCPMDLACQVGPIYFDCVHSTCWGSRLPAFWKKLDTQAVSQTKTNTNSKKKQKSWFMLM